jgi:hypothetical protein
VNLCVAEVLHLMSGGLAVLGASASPAPSDYGVVLNLNYARIVSQGMASQAKKYESRMARARFVKALCYGTRSASASALVSRAPG